MKPYSNDMNYRQVEQSSANSVLPRLPEAYDGSSGAYEQWSESRLKKASEIHGDRYGGKETKEHSFHHLNSTNCLANSVSELQALCADVRNAGYALYTWQPKPDNVERSVSQLNRKLQLHDIDTGVITESSGMSLLENLEGSPKGKYIPYSRKAMNWHTDGYYNSNEELVRCFSLHCLQPAKEGGTLSLFDHELLLVALYSENPDMVSLLSHPEAMLLPANKDDIGHNRPDRQAAVIFAHSDGSLGMRFTARTRNISWRNKDTENAAQRALELINENSHHHTVIKLAAGQGIFTRNILHRRDAFTDAENGFESVNAKSTAENANPKRQMLRGRYTRLPMVAGSCR